MKQMIMYEGSNMIFRQFRNTVDKKQPFHNVRFIRESRKPCDCEEIGTTKYTSDAMRNLHF